MITNDNPLESLEFLDLLSADDPIDSPAYDPNKNIAPDILSGQPLTPTDDVLDDEEEEDETPTPPAPKTPPANEPPAPSDEPDDEPEPLEEEEEDDDINYFATFGKGLIKAGMLELEEGEDPEQVEWTEQTFLDKMEQTIE